jgi:two-component system sensor histidine kinase CpxA
VRSVTAKILLWCLGVLAFSWVAFVLTAQAVSRSMRPRPDAPSAESIDTGLTTAIQAYQVGGVARLNANLAARNRTVFGKYHLLDSAGRDLANGSDRSTLLAGMRPGESRVLPDGSIAFLAGANREYSLIWLSDWVTAPGMLGLRDLIPYYALILAAVAGLFWLLARNIASPVRRLAATVNRFGAGDLAVRVHSSRRDEIGNLSRAFDRMAERIATLLTAERRLLQDVSHELRSPLARLTFATELVRTAEDREAAVARVKKEIARLSELINALIEMTRAEGDPSLHRMAEIDLSELVRQVTEDYADSAIHLKVPPGRQRLTILGDRELLRRAFENVIQNAIRYSAAGAAVELATEPLDSAVRVSVRDRGPGVPEEALARIFEPFYRVDTSRTEATGGVGLGLAIAARAIALHHGKIWAENAQPGLRVIIELPRNSSP